MCKCTPSLRTPYCPNCVNSEAKPKETTYLSRMEVELEDLLGKHERLDAFIGTSKFNALPEEDRSLLEQQFDAMTAYALCLSMRIDRA